MPYSDSDEESYSGESFLSGPDPWEAVVDKGDGRCLGVTAQGKRCTVKTKSKYCPARAQQGATFREGASGNEPGKSKPPGESDARAPKPPCFEGSEYGLAAALCPAKPTVPADCALPAWASRCTSENNASLQDHARAFDAFIVHAATKAVVGFVRGRLVRRSAALEEIMHQLPDESYDLISDLFSPRYGFKLRTEYKSPKSFWGDSLDSGRIVVIERLEIESAHRGKGALRQLGAPLRTTCRAWGASSAFAKVAFVKPDGVVIDPAASAPKTAVNDKLRNSFASMGFRRIGITDYMAMVVDASHACWKASSHKPPEFPFREVAKIVKSPAFVSAVKDCAKAKCAENNAYRGRSREWVEADVVAEATAAVDAMANHDAKKFFGCAEYGMPAQLMYEALITQPAVWKPGPKPLRRNIEELLAKMLKLGRPLDTAIGYGVFYMP